MRGLIELAMNNSRAVTVIMLTVVILGGLTVTQIPMDVLPVYNSPAVQTLTFYAGMPSEEVANTISSPMERMTGQSAGIRRQDSRSIIGVSIVRNYFNDAIDPNGALTQTNSLALGEIPNLPPGTLPPVVLPFDPTSTVPVCIVAVGSREAGESALYDVGRYEVRQMIMSSPGSNAPVVFGGKVRAVLAEVDPDKLAARGMTMIDVLESIEKYNLFLPTGDANIGKIDYAIDSNSMFKEPKQMEDIPLRDRPGGRGFLGDIAQVRDTHLIQMCAVRIDGRREVYVPVFRQHGTSTLQVVDHLKQALPDIQSRLSRPDVKLKLVMDQSVYVRQSIRSLAIEGVLGAVLCSVVILLFLGEWRMTAIAVLSIPIAVLAALVGLYLLKQTVNVMTLAGLALAIGPLVDSAIICLENTHRHLIAGDSARQAALEGASEVALPELAATCATLLVLAPLALMPGSGQFLFRPLAIAVALAMASSYLLSRTFVPSRAANWLRSHAGGGSNQNQRMKPGNQQDAENQEQSSGQQHSGLMGRLLQHVQNGINVGLDWYNRQLGWVLEHRLVVILTAAGLLTFVVLLITPFARREFFPEADSGAFEIYVRANSGTRLTETEKQVENVEKLIHDTIGHDIDLVISEIGVWADWSAAFTPNSGTMDAVVKVQFVENRRHTSQFYAAKLRHAMAKDPRFVALDVAFNTGGAVRSALNEGKNTPINVRVIGKDLSQSRAVAERIRTGIMGINGVVDVRIMQRLDYPSYIIEVDRAKARTLGFSQKQVMENVIAALKSSIQFNKKNFWFDPVTHNQYYVGVQYPEKDIQSLETILNVSITSDLQQQPIALSNLVKLKPSTMATEVTHTDLQSAIDLTLNVEGRDLGHVASEIAEMMNQYGKWEKAAKWIAYDPTSSKPKLIEGTKIEISGESQRMQETFFNFGIGLLLAIVFIYFLLVILLDSYLIPTVILAAVPVGLVGVLPTLFLTGTAINVQSLLGVIFMIGIVVSNTTLLVDFAEKIRHDEKLNATEAIRKAASVRAKPVVMTALSAFFALVPMALALEQGSEANAPLGRAVIGGLLAGLVTTLAVVPALYSLVVRESNHDRTNRDLKGSAQTRP